MIESTAIRYFREVAQEGSIKHAADRLFVVPSAISRQIQGLEDELGVKLFERGARGMTLTPAGYLLLEYAQDSSTRLSDMRSRFDELHSPRRGMVRIGTVEGMLASFLPDFLGEFSATHPNIATSIVTVGSNDVAELTARHEVDLGFVFGPPPRHDLIELALMRQPLCLVTAPHHPLAGRAQCAVRDLADLRVVVPDLSFGIRQEVDRACAEARIKLEVMCETNSLAFACKLVTRTGLATFLPRYATLPELEAGVLTAVPILDKKLAATGITLVQSATRPLTPVSRHVANLLAARMKAVPLG